MVVGNPRPRSRTLVAATAVARTVTGAEPDRVVDLTELGARLLDWEDAAVAELVAEVEAARVVVFATPTYKGSYTGLLKLFLDRFASGSLAGVLAVPLMLGASERHALAVEVFLKPVLAELGATTLGPGLYLLDAHWQDLEPIREQLEGLRRRVVYT